MTGQKAEDERRLGGHRRAPRRLDRGLDLKEHDARLVEKHAAGSGQFNALGAANHQRATKLGFEVAHLAAEGRLRGVQPLLCGDGQAAFFSDGNEVAEVA